MRRERATTLSVPRSAGDYALLRAFDEGGQINGDEVIAHEPVLLCQRDKSVRANMKFAQSHAGFPDGEQLLVRRQLLGAVEVERVRCDCTWVRAQALEE